MADLALGMLEIDKLGLDNVDRRMLESIIRFYDGGPVGIDTLAATIGEEAVTIEDVYEPYLIQIGFLNRTQRGRCVTRLAYEHLGIPFSGGLFTGVEEMGGKRIKGASFAGKEDIMWTADKWQDYELCDASDGERLERWENYILRRPDPQVIWKTRAAQPTVEACRRHLYTRRRRRPLDKA